MRASKHTMAGRRQWILKLLSEGSHDKAHVYAHHHHMDQWLKAHLADAPGGEGDAVRGRAGNPNKSTPAGNFLEKDSEELASRAKFLASREEARRAALDSAGREAAPYGEERRGREDKGNPRLQQPGVVGGKDKLVKDIDSGMSANDAVIMEMKNERENYERERPLPDEGVGKVVGYCGNRGMVIVEVETSGGKRDSSLWTGGYNLQIGEVCAVKVSERIGNDAIYEVVRRGLPDGEGARTNDGLTVAPVGFASVNEIARGGEVVGAADAMMQEAQVALEQSVSLQSGEQGVPESGGKEKTAPFVERSLDEILADERARAMRDFSG